MTAPLLAVEGLKVAYHRNAVALHGVSLTVVPQAIVAILGNNGAGKTTTLRAISGFIGLDNASVVGGSIRFAGERIENRPPHANAARGIVLVPERDKVFPNLTVAENLTASSSARARMRAGAPTPGSDRLCVLSGTGKLAVAARRLTLRRRAADAGDRQRRPVQSAIAAGG